MEERLGASRSGVLGPKASGCHHVQSSQSNPRGLHMGKLRTKLSDALFSFLGPPN
jgi:hypothetical protein